MVGNIAIRSVSPAFRLADEGAIDPETGNSEPVAEPFVATWHDDVANHDR